MSDTVKTGVDAAAVAEHMMSELSVSDEYYVLEDDPIVENDSAGFTFVVNNIPYIVSVRQGG